MDMSVGEPVGTALCLALRGRLDTVGVDKLDAAFGAAVAGAAGDAAVDLGQVSFLSSMGVRMIIAAARAQRARGHTLLLFGAQPVVQATLEMVALDQIIPIVRDRETAVTRLAS